jgi:YesN/AraC family two-component response regulator
MTSQYDIENVFELGQFPVSVRGDNLLTPAPAVKGEHRFHQEIEIQFIFHGNANYFVRDISYPVKSNSVLIIGSEEIHAHTIDAGSTLTKICLMMHPRIFSENQLAASILDQLLCARHLNLTGKQMASVEYLLQSIGQELDAKESQYTEIVVNHINCILIKLCRAIANTGPAETNNNPLIKAAIQYIDSNYSENISLDSTAAYLGLSPCYLSSVFKRYVGMGFKVYLTQRRIIEAKALLKSTSLKITAIAFQVGFNSISAFYKDFQTITGITPTGFRSNSTHEF